MAYVGIGTLAVIMSERMSRKLPVGSLEALEAILELTTVDKLDVLKALEEVFELITVEKLDIFEALEEILELTTADKPDVVKVVDPD